MVLVGLSSLFILCLSATPSEDMSAGDYTLYLLCCPFAGGFFTFICFSVLRFSSPCRLVIQATCSSYTLRSLLVDSAFSSLLIIHWQLTVKQASDLSDIKIVSLDWLLKSVEKGEKFDEDKYLMANSNSAAVKDEDVEDEDVKDEDAKDDGVKKVDTSKKRSRNGKVKAASPESDEEEQKPPAKKQKDTQKAKSRNLNIPIDEGCSLKGQSS